MVFVDTPGVSDNDTLSQRLYDYLPNAMAFIYILNSTNDGGVQRDRVIALHMNLMGIPPSPTLKVENTDKNIHWE